MKMIEVSAVVAENGIISVPEKEFVAMGLKKGDEICISFINQNGQGNENLLKEFAIQKNVK